MDLLGASSTALFLGAMAVGNLSTVLKFFRVDMGCPQGFVCQDTVHGFGFRMRDVAELVPSSNGEVV